MGILEKYQIVSMIGAGETSSFRAQEVSTGGPVVVHQFLRGQSSPGQPDLMSMVYTYLSRADAPGIEHYLDSGEEEDTVFIVTSDVPQCLDLRQWLQSMAVALGEGGPATDVSLIGPSPTEAPSAPEPLQQSPPETRHEPGEFANMFSTPPSQTPSPAAASGPESNPQPAAKPADKRSRGQVPSGFEVVYQSRKRATNVGPAPEPSAPTVVAPMQAPTEPAPASVNVPDDEFAQMFSGASNGKTDKPVSPTPPASAAPPGAVAPREKSDTGGFTQMFRGVSAGNTNQPPTPPPSAAATSAPAPEQKPVKSGPGEFTQMFNTRQATPGQPAPRQPSPLGYKPSTPPVSPAPKKPGDFTLMFQADTQAPAKAEPPLPAPSPAVTTPPVGSAPPGHIQQPPAFLAPKGDTQKPGEFTQMFKSGGEPPRSPILGDRSRPQAPLSSSSKKAPGEFTMLMQGYKAPSATPAAPKVLEAPKPLTPPPADATKKGPGEFTLMFRTPSPPTAPVPQTAPPPVAVQQAPSAPRAHQPGEYTSIFEAPRMPAAGPQSAAPANPAPGYGFPAPPVAPVAPQMPVYQPPPPPSYAMAPPPAPQMQPMTMPPPPATPQFAPPAETKKPPIFWLLLMVLGCLFLTAVVLVLYFAIKH